MRRSLSGIALVAAALALAACCCENRCRPSCSPCGQPTEVALAAVPGTPAAPSVVLLEAPAVVTVNATCPVLLGNAVDPRYTTVYKGKLVGFCCPMCKAKFEKDPEKYAKNLP